MKSFTIRLAGQYFTICPVCDYIRKYCKDYIVADDTEAVSYTHLTLPTN